MLEINYKLISTGWGKMADLESKIKSESFHSGQGCNCATCMDRNGLWNAILDLENFEDNVKYQLEETESRLKYYVEKESA